MSAAPRLQQAPADAARARSRGLEQVNLGTGDGTVAYRVEFEYPGKGATVLEDLGVYTTPDLAAVAHDVVACKVAFDAAKGDSASLEGVAADLNFPLNCYNFQRQFWASLRKSSLPQVILDVKSRGLAEQLYFGPTRDAAGGAQMPQQQQGVGAGGGAGAGRQPQPPPGKPPQQQQQRGGAQRPQQPPQQRPGGPHQQPHQRPMKHQPQQPQQQQPQQQQHDGERHGPAPPAKRQKTGQPEPPARYPAPHPASAASAASKQAAGGSRQQQQQQRSPDRRQQAPKAEPAAGKAAPAGAGPPSPPAARNVGLKAEAAAGSPKKPPAAGSPKKPSASAAAAAVAAAAAAAAGAAPASPKSAKPPASPGAGKGRGDEVEAEAGAGSPASQEPFNIWLKDVEWPPGSRKFPLYVKNTQLRAYWFTLTASAVEGFAKEAEDGEFILEEHSTHSTYKTRFWIKLPKDGAPPAKDSNPAAKQGRQCYITRLSEFFTQTQLKAGDICWFSPADHKTKAYFGIWRAGSQEARGFTEVLMSQQRRMGKRKAAA